VRLRCIRGLTALAAYADRAGVRAPATVAPIDRFIAAVALPTEPHDLFIENLACEQTCRFGVVLQEMELDVEAAAQHTTEASAEGAGVSGSGVVSW